MYYDTVKCYPFYISTIKKMHYKYQIINVYASTRQLRPLNIKWELFFVLSADYTSTKRVNHRRDQQQRFVSTSRLVLRFKC